MQRAVADRRLGASGTRAVTHPAHLGPTTIGNHVIHRLIQAGSLSGDSSEFAPSYPPVSELLNEVLGGPGQSLDRETRNFMESRFGYDFSQVKLHTDSKAAESAAAVDAKAYTVGDEIVFGAGEFSPGTVEGRRLLAHELTHVLQQATGPAIGSSVLDGSISISEPADPSEMEAEEVSALVSSSDIYPVSPVQGENSPAGPGATVQREGDDQEDNGIWDVVKGPLASWGGKGVDTLLEAGEAAEGTGALVPGVGGLLGGAMGVLEGAQEGGPLGALKGIGGGLEIAGGVGDAALAGGAAEAGIAGTLADAGPVGIALGTGLAAGGGMATIADSSYTKTGAFGTDESTGQNQSAMDWGASWGTDWDKAHGNTDPSIMGGILAGAGGIVGGIGGAAYGAANWLGDQF